MEITRFIFVVEKVHRFVVTKLVKLSDDFGIKKQFSLICINMYLTDQPDYFFSKAIRPYCYSLHFRDARRSENLGWRVVMWGE